jgi:hypothetical protein
LSTLKLRLLYLPSIVKQKNIMFAGSCEPFSAAFIQNLTIIHVYVNEINQILISLTYEYVNHETVSLFSKFCKICHIACANRVTPGFFNSDEKIKELRKQQCLNREHNENIFLGCYWLTCLLSTIPKKLIFQPD